MAAVWMRFRVEFRSHWRAWVAVALLAGLAGGTLVAVAASARRTDSALARYIVAYRSRDASIVNSSATYLKPVEKLPQVAASSIVAVLGFDNTPKLWGRSLSILGPHAIAVYASTDGREGVLLDRWKLLAGRLPDSSRVDEAVLDSRAARTFGVGVGDTVAFTFSGARVRLRVVGVVASTDPIDHPAGVVNLTPAFYRAHLGSAFEYVLDVRLRHGAVDLPAFQSGAERILGRPSFPADQRFHTRAIQNSIHPLVQALWFSAGLGALLSLLLLTQSLARLSFVASLQHPTFRALGMTQSQLVAIGIARAGTIAVGAAVVAVGTSVALSPLAPVGYARELEPTPGFAVDRLAVGLGGVAVLAAVLLAGSIAAWQTCHRRARLADRTRPVRTADALARLGMPAPITTGVRFALARGGSAIAGRTGSALVGSILAVTVVGTALTFSASLHHLFATPRLFGQNWDFRIDAAGSEPSTLASDRSISAVAVGTDKGFVQVNGRQVGVRAMEFVKGSMPPTVIEGRAPTKANEILLGTKTMQALGVRIGDMVDVSSDQHVHMRVVGRGVLPIGAYLHNELGEGAAMTWAAYSKLSHSYPDVFEVRIAPGADRARTLAKLEQRFRELPPGLPAPAVDFGGVNDAPAVISLLLAAIAVGALAQTLVLAVRRRRRDLAILKTLGFDRRQVLATVAWQATSFAAIGLLVGLPLGDALGRWAWNLFAEQLGVVPEAVVPVPLLLLMVPGGIVLANLIALVPGRIAAGTRPALVLRAE